MYNSLSINKVWKMFINILPTFKKNRFLIKISSSSDTRYLLGYRGKEYVSSVSIEYIFLISTKR